MAAGDLAGAGVTSLALLGCGKMGSALLEGWLAGGIDPASVQIIEPYPSDWLKAQGVVLNPDELRPASVAIIAVKPQMIADTAPALRAAAEQGSMMLSIAAGTTIATFEEIFSATAAIVRVMPNTPAAVGRGISALVGNGAATDAHLTMAETLMASVGQTVRLESEAQMDAVTGVSGSGPAYVFHMIEALAQAGMAEGLPEAMAMQLARATVAGAGALADASGESAEQLRVNVTSPGGTTAAGLSVLMEELPDLMTRTVAAAAGRSRELQG